MKSIGYWAFDMASIEARREADARRRHRQPYRKLYDHVRQGCRAKRPKFTPRMIALLGYDFDDFKQRIEQTFTVGMTWDGFVRGDIHLDHIIPLGCFSATDKRDIKLGWALSNLQALWPEDNQAKVVSDRHLIQIARQKQQGPLSVLNARGA